MILNKKAKEEKAMLMGMEFTNFAIIVKYLVNEEEWSKISEASMQGVMRAIESKGDYNDMIAQAEMEVNNVLAGEVALPKYTELVERLVKLEKDMGKMKSKAELILSELRK